MPSRPRALIAALLVAAGCGPALTDPGLSEPRVFVWDDAREAHGGYSALLMESDGTSAWVVSDRGQMVRIALDRQADGAIASVATERVLDIARPGERRRVDSEGIARRGGQLFVSGEGPPRVYSVETGSGVLTALPPHQRWRRLAGNRQLEGLAADADGRLWTLPENPGENGRFVFSIFQDGAWRDGPVVPSTDSFQAVGLDFGPDGRLYLLERRLVAPLGFASRLRRLSLDGTAVAQVETLLTTSPGTHDNLEGLSVWRDAEGRLVASLISDDNFLFLQRTEIVEYVLSGG